MDNASNRWYLSVRRTGGGTGGPYTIVHSNVAA